MLQQRHLSKKEPILPHTLASLEEMIWGEGKEEGKFTENDAIQIASTLREKCPAVLDIEIFGSVARKGNGNDIDMVVCVPDEMSQEFFELVRSGLMESWCGYLSSASLRLSIAEYLLDESFEDLEDSLDVFLLPSNWRYRIQELQQELPHTDPNFMNNIARDAKVIA